MRSARVDCLGPGERERGRHHAYDKARVARYEGTKARCHRQRVVQRRTTADAVDGRVRGHKSKHLP